MVEFFTKNDGFTRILTEMSAIFYRYGRVYGAVRLLDPTRAEENALSSFFERDYFNQALIRISLADFQRQLEKVNPNQNFAALLSYYMPQSNGADLQKNTNAFTKGIYDILPKYKNTIAEPWLKEICAQMRRGYKFLTEQFLNDPALVFSDIDKVAKLCLQLPGGNNITPLSDFCGQEKRLEPLLLRAIAHLYAVPVPQNQESVTALYLEAGLLSGGALCHVMVKNLIGIRKVENKPSEICELYRNSGQIHVLTLENVVQFTSTAIQGSAFVIEDPNAYVAICELLGETEHTIICPMNGNANEHNPAFTRLLDLLCGAGNCFYYAGEMDYSGLARADKLYQKYGKHFVPWRYTKSDYEMLISNSYNFIHNGRQDLAMLNESLALILSQIRKTGMAPNNMSLVPVLAEDIKRGV